MDRRLLITRAFIAILAAVGFAAGAETADDCTGCRYTRNLYFGDLHVHTAFSFDAFGFGVRTEPLDGYLQMRESLDFAAVTDHAEFLGEVSLCETPGSPGYDTGICVALREGDFNALKHLDKLCLTDPSLLDPALCAEAAAQIWVRLKHAANAAYKPGEFTTLIAYEYSLQGTRDIKLHRNVIFSGENVPAPLSRYDALDEVDLWRSLGQHCRPEEGCDAVVIPHTSNASRGHAFPIADSEGNLLPPSEMGLRAKYETLVEIYQTKGNSECYRVSLADDEGCEFEKLPLYRVAARPDSTVVPKQSWVREALKLGLMYQEIFGINPYQFGFIGSTDTHMGVGGQVSEKAFDGNAGTLDDTIQERLGSAIAAASSPGGLAAVWAKENTREGIFAALKNREVYATSGTRILARFFGGWNYTPDLCSNPRMPEIAARTGVPMGGTLEPPEGAAPFFIVSAQQDPESAGIKSLQIVKTWAVSGHQFERVFTIKTASGPSGAHTLCEVWQDQTFDPTQHAAYYARVIEAPTTRWSGYDCKQAGVDCRVGAPPGLEACCDGSVPMKLQERAWTSPIWYTPQ
jgi:hypothetical protein